jgi:probable phosphoglycerate mutase
LTISGHERFLAANRSRGARPCPARVRRPRRQPADALAVFHGGVNRILISHALAGGRAYFGTFEQVPACINVLDLGDDDRWIVRTVNSIPYDPLHPARETTMEHLWVELKAWLNRD